MKTEQEIKQALALLLSKDEVDYTKILSLTNELSAFDKDNVRFSVDAGIINRLGKELVGKGETAISELIKNGYDAEATYVNLIFQSAYQRNGTLIIEDDGNGMSYDELINGFMRLSSSDKIHNPISPKYHRVKAGKKGIGRFATQRLGTQLTIITQKEDSETAIKAHINWDNFLFDKNLNEIESTIEYVAKERIKGTTLIIENLRDSWSDASVQRAYRYTENLLQPEPLSKERKNWDNSRQDPGFKATFFREHKSEKNIVINEDLAFYDHALAVIDGYIDEHGFGYWRCQSAKLEINSHEYRRVGCCRNDDDTPYTSLRGIHFKTHYFIYDKNLIPSTLFTYVKNLGNELGGIKLYRNGFRVSPYGESGNDWLGFDESVRRRTYIFPHQNQSFFGFVEIDALSADLFEETSSREGLIENDAYRELTDFVYRAVIGACTDIAAARNRKGTAAQKDWTKKSPSEKIEESMQKLSSLIDGDENNKSYSEDEHNSKHQHRSEQFKEAFKQLDEGYKEERDEKQKLIEENNMLRIFAALGLVIGEFVHEIKNYLPGFEAEINYIMALLENDEVATKRVLRLNNNMKAFTSYASFFDKTISRGVQREVENINVKERIQTFCETVKTNRKKANIKIYTNLEVPQIILSNILTVPMHPSEWASILFNLYTNAKKAIKKQNVEGKIGIICGQDQDNVFIEFSDNGTGVDPRVKDTMFEAFVTTTPVAPRGSDDIDTYTGTGLGLKIVRDIILSYNGNVFLKSAPNEGYRTTFRIEIPKKND